MLKFKKLLTIIACVAISLSAQAKLTVFAAASMTNVLEEIKKEYLKQKPNEEIIFSFASSSVLAKQINKGRPADIFISADQKWMDFLAEANAIDSNSRVDLVGNKLVIIAPKESKIKEFDVTKTDWQNKLSDKNSFLAVGDPNHVPAGKYAKAALTYLKQWDDVKDKLAPAKNVRAALALVELGESPLGIVYATDAAASEKVKVVSIFPDGSHPPVEYPAAIVKNHDNENSREFIKFLKTEPAKRIFTTFGFINK